MIISKKETTKIYKATKKIISHKTKHVGNWKNIEEILADYKFPFERNKK